MFDASTVNKIKQTARELGVDPEDLLAVAEVESAGVSFWTVKGKKVPAVRFEGHYFHRMLKGAQLQRAISAGLASPKVGGVKNPKSWEARYDLIDRARKINRDVADMSCSWGLGQVMGSHWKKLGYNSVAELVEECHSGVAGQVEVMAKYIKVFGLVDELQRDDDLAFAKGYNGPMAQKWGYDKKIKAARRRWQKHLNGESNAEGMPTTITDVEVEATKVWQRQLADLGYYRGPIDGRVGPKTKMAIRALQRKNGLVEDGIYGPMVQDLIDRKLIEATNSSTDVLDKAGKVTTGVGATGEVVKNAGEQLQWLQFDSPVFQFVIAGLILLGVGLIVWAQLRRIKDDD